MHYTRPSPRTAKPSDDAADGRAAKREELHMATRLLTLRDVTAMTALSRSAVYALMAKSRFPKPIRLGTRAVRWVEQEVLDFIASRPRAGSDRPAA